MKKIIYRGISDIGLKRNANQDGILMYSKSEYEISLFAVADGMGGHSHGELASREIIIGLKNWISSIQPQFFQYNFSKLMRLLEDKLLEINRKIFHEYNQDKVCGSTCVILLIYGENYGVINVGDSRIFHKRGFKVKSLMEDDVWENQRKIKSSLSKTKIRNHPNYGKLIQSVGTRKDVYLSVKTNRLREGEAFMLCSDGLYKYCPTRVYKKVLKKVSIKNLEDSISILMKKVYEAGAGDNISLILVKCI